MIDFEAKIVDFEKRAANLSAKLIGLSERRKGFALRAVDGETTAVKEIEDIDREIESLHRESETVAAAIEHVEQMRREKAEEDMRRDEEEREAEARKIAAAVLSISADIDAAMTSMRALLERRTQLGQELGRTGVVSPTIILRLQQKLGPTAAARAAGLHNFLSLEPMQVNQARSLVASSSVPIRRSTTADDETEAA